MSQDHLSPFARQYAETDEERARRHKEREESDRKQATALAAVTVDAIQLLRRIWDSAPGNAELSHEMKVEAAELMLRIRKLPTQRWMG